MRLADKLVLITGAARGIGRACALRAAEEGADLALLDDPGVLPGVPYRLGTAEQLERTAELARKHGVSVLTASVDVRSAARVDAAVAEVADRFGRIDVLVNNAGIGSPSGREAHAVTEEEWQVMLEVNLSGVWRVMRAVVPVMLAQGSGSIINVASTAGLTGYRYFAGYVAAKHGVIGLTKAAALDYAPFGVRVNALCPGPVRDDPEMDGQMTQVVADALGISLDEQEAVDRESVAMNEVVDPLEVADAMLWLAGDGSRKVTGTTVVVDAGFSAR